MRGLILVIVCELFNIVVPHAKSDKQVSCNRLNVVSKFSVNYTLARSTA